jgi:hypothetical protein
MRICRFSLVLSGGAPLGYFNYEMLQQVGLQGVESAVLFGAAALAMDFAFRGGWVSKFK